MGEYSVKRPLKRPPIHPDEILREDVLPALGLSVSEAARRLGISRQQLHRVLAYTHPITTEMALRDWQVCRQRARALAAHATGVRFVVC